MTMPSVFIAKRRASLARLLAFLFTVAIGVALFASPTAHAEKPLAPLITTTDPVSSEAAPAQSTTPLVRGDAEPEGGIIISGLERRSWSGGAVARAGEEGPTDHPEYEIQLFAQAGCQGLPAASGRADLFETTGMSVTVGADAKTVLSALQIDPSDPTKPSECSRPFSYWEGNVPAGGGAGGGGGEGGGVGAPPGSSPGAAGQGEGKPAPPRLRLSPAGRANFNEPRLHGSAPGAASVLVFIGPNCNGSPLAKGSPEQLGAGLQVHVEDDTTTIFSAASVGAQRSACSAPVTYVEDSTAPRTRITMGPGAKTRKRKAVLRFADITDDAPGTSFLCKVDRAKWKPCSSPLRLRHLRFRRHVVKVKAIDGAGNAEAKPVRHKFKVVRRS
jgi:hypothetical protein